MSTTSMLQQPHALMPGGSAQDRLLELATGYMLPAALHVAIELDLADRLAGGPADVSEMARDTGVNADALYRVLRLLASAGVFEEIAPRTFAMTPLGEPLCRHRSCGVRDLVAFLANPFHFDVYRNAMSSVRTGMPAVQDATGTAVFDHFARTPALASQFHDAMTNISATTMPSVLEAYDFAGVELLVDVAGGHGHVLTSILKTYPRMRGLLYDVPHVVEGARTRITALGLSHRCRAEAGDMFHAIPVGGDAYVLKNVIHDWNDDQALQILRNVRLALGQTLRGKAILLETLVEPGNAPHAAKLSDVEMLMMTGGKERTAHEYAALFENAGFRLSRIVPTASAISVIEAEAR